MSGSKPPSSASTSRDGSPGLRLHQGIGGDPYARSSSRTSLDLPYRDNSWNSQRGRTLTNDNGQAELHPPTAPVARHRSPAASMRQRPISMGPLSPPRTPPVVRVDSPRSPPKPLASVNSTPRSGANGSTPESSYQKLNPFPGRQFKIPSRPSSPRPEFRTSQAPTQANAPPYYPRGGLSSVEHGEGDFGVSTGSPLKDPQKLYPADRTLITKGLAIPPTINRAEKPKIPSKPPLISTRTDGAGLGSTNSIDDTASPFSTPPSSDDEE